MICALGDFREKSKNVKIFLKMISLINKFVKYLNIFTKINKNSY